MLALFLTSCRYQAVSTWHTRDIPVPQCYVTKLGGHLVRVCCLGEDCYIEE